MLTVIQPNAVVFSIFCFSINLVSHTVVDIIPHIGCSAYGRKMAKNVRFGIEPSESHICRITADYWGQSPFILKNRN